MSEVVVEAANCLRHDDDSPFRRVGTAPYSTKAKGFGSWTPLEVATTRSKIDLAAAFTEDLVVLVPHQATFARLTSSRSVLS